MKLIGSLIETEIQDGLLKNKITPNKFNVDKRILKILKNNVQNFKCGYILSWTPDQGEDIYSILASGEIVFKIEVNRLDQTQEATWTTISLINYRKALKGKPAQITLEIALKLLKHP